jgi:hypothetical protein
VDSGPTNRSALRTFRRLEEPNSDEKAAKSPCLTCPHEIQTIPPSTSGTGVYENIYLLYRTARQFLKTWAKGNNLG